MNTINKLHAEGNTTRKIFTVLFLSSLFVFCFYWFSDCFSKYMYGDDSATFAVVDTWSKGYLRFIFEPNGPKYRPVLCAILYPIFKLFGPNMSAVVCLNIIIEYLMGILLFFYTKKIMNRKWLSAFIVLMFIMCRFTTYNISQTIGILETLSIFFVILFLQSAYEVIVKNSADAIIKAIIVYGLIIYTHERFIVLIVPLLLVICFSQWNKKGKLLLLSGVSVFLLLSNILLKHFLVGAKFLTGTGGTDITVNIPVIIKFALLHVLYILGINNSDAYLNGIAGSNVALPIVYIIIASIVALLLIIIIYIYIMINSLKGKSKKQIERQALINELVLCAIYLSAIMVIIASSSVTIRVELRWVYAPYVAALFLLSVMLARIMMSRIKLKRLGLIVFTAYFILVSGYNIYYKQFRLNTYLGIWMNYGNAVEDVIKEYGRTIENYNVFFSGVVDPIAPSAFYPLFGKDYEQHIAIFTVGSPAEIDFANQNRQVLALQYDAASKKFINVTDKFKVGHDFATAVKQDELYVDGWLGSTGGLQIASGEKGQFSMTCNILDKFPDNILQVYVNDVLAGEVELHRGSTPITLDVPKNRIVKITLKAKNVVKPIDLGLNGDVRNLSIYLTDTVCN